MDEVAFDLNVEAARNVTPRWYAIYTSPRHEKRIAQHFSMREIDHFLPTYQVPRRWKDGSKGVVELPLFPNYLFVRITLPERVRVIQVPGVLSLVGGRNATPLPDCEMRSLCTGVKLHKVEPHPYLVIGQRAIIKGGAFAGMAGILIRRKNESRVVLTLEAIMRSMAVEVDVSNLEISGENVHDILTFSRSVAV